MCQVARFLYCTTCDPGTVLIWVRLWQQELRLTFRFAGLHICILLIYLIRFVSKNWKLLSELQLPVVFIDSHHETGEGKEASFCSQFCSYFTFTFHCYVFTFTFTFILLLLLFIAMYSLSLISPLLSGSRVFSRDEHTLAHPSKIAPLGKCDQGWKIIRSIWKIESKFFSHNWSRLFWMWRRNLGNCMKSKNSLMWLLFGCNTNTNTNTNTNLGNGM